MIPLTDVRTALAHGSTALLIRHAPRTEIRSASDSGEAQVTPEGAAAAECLGASIGGLLDSRDRVILAHSPVGRCQRTAACLHAGITRSVPDAHVVGVRQHLGGPYMRNATAALEAMFELGGSRFFRNWFHCTLPDTLVQPVHEAAPEQLQGALAALDGSPPPRLAVLVTHDWNLLLVREHYFGIRHEEAGWIDFLDGFAIVRGTSHALVWHGGKRIVVAGSG